MKGLYLVRQKFKKVSQIDGVSVARHDAGLQFHCAKIQSGKLGQLIEYGPQLLSVVFFLLEGVVAHALNSKTTIR